jgi:putative cell wall-binding protein
MRKVFNLLSLMVLLALALSLAPPAALAQDEVACDSDVVVQANDWLSKLADKF